MLSRVLLQPRAAADHRGERRGQRDAVVGYSERLQEDAREHGWNDIVADLERIHGAGLTLLNLIQSVVDLASVSALAKGDAGSRDRMRTTRMPGESTVQLAAVPGRLLVVDDGELDRDMLVRRLTRLGHEVDTARDAFQALAMLAERQYDLVLCDILLPEMTGADLLEQLKADDRLRDIPVIMLSALDQAEWVAQCVQLGAEDYLPKPYETMVLHARIDTSLEKRRLRLKEMDYLAAAQRVCEAAEALQASSFEPACLDGVGARDDGLGVLARAFQRMAREVVDREQRLRSEVQHLRIEINAAQAAREVAAITDTDFFRQLEAKAEHLRFAAR